MRKKERYEKIPCPRHSGYCTILSESGWIKTCPKCGEEYDNWAKEMNKKLKEYWDEKVKELIGETK